MYLRFEQAFVNGYILDESVRLFAGSRFANQPGFWFYFRILGPRCCRGPACSSGVSSTTCAP